MLLLHDTHLCLSPVKLLRLLLFNILEDIKSFLAIYVQNITYSLSNNIYICIYNFQLYNLKFNRPFSFSRQHLLVIPCCRQVLENCWQYVAEKK